ncbi:hypothetical protein [Moellerella wisconsensis]|uniref:hypothetical protein n=1 Tax=Moellerella wisconsensis TaxID=158849 RepID=UPI003AAE6FE7
MSESQSVGGIHYDVSMEIKELLVGEKQVNKVMDNVEKSTDKATNSLNKLDKVASQVGVAMKMPEVNKLSRDMAQLSGKIGANSAATDKAVQVNSKFTGVLSTASGAIGAGYVGNIGSATESLIKHTQAAINATAEEVKNAEAMQKQAQAYQAEASQLILATQEKRKSAEESIKLAQSELQIAGALADKKTAHIESLEALHKEQQYQLRQAELAHEAIGNEKTLAEVVKARSAAQRTQNQIEKQSTAIAQEVWKAEDKVKSAKEAHKKATIELTQAEALEKQAKVTATAAEEAATAARNRATAATKAQAVAMTGLKSVMALFGGPAGILLLAAAGVYALYQAMGNNSSIDDYKNKVSEAIQKVDELTQSQAKAAANQAKLAIKIDTESLDKAAKRIKEVQATIKYMEENPFEWMQNAGAMAFTYESRLASLKDKLDELRGDYDTYSGSVDNLATQQDKLNKASEAGPIATGDAAKSVKILKSEYSSLADQHAVLNELFLNGAQAAELMAYKLNLENKYAEQGIAITDDIKRSIDDAVASKKQLMETQGSANLKQQLDSIKTNVEALKIEYQQGAKAAAIFRAEQFLSKQDGLDPKIAKEYIEGVKQQYEWQGKVNTKNKELSSSLKNSKKDMEQVTNAIKRQKDEIERLNKGYEEGSKQLAQYDASKALGDKASPKQIAEAERLAGELYDIQQRLTDKRAALAANSTATAEKLKSDEIEQLDRQLKANLVTEEQYQKRKFDIATEYANKIADIKVTASVNYIEENRAKFDPIQALANEQAKKLVMMEDYQKREQALLEESYAKQQITHEQFTAAKEATDAQYLMLRTAAENEFNRQMTDAGWELLRQQSLGYEMLTGAIDSFAGNASNALTGIITGSMSAEEALRSMGSTILNTLVNSFVQMGVEMVKNFILSQTLGKASTMAAAATATAGGSAALAAWTPAAIAASIATLGTASATGLTAFQTAMAGGQMASQLSGMGTQAVGMAFGGGRESGGPVSADKYYRVGENGKPEIYQASSGKQYMIPGDNGRVISNKDISGSSGRGGSITQEISITIHTTNGIQDSDIAKLKEMMKTTAMMTIKDQKRVGGMLS